MNGFLEVKWNHVTCLETKNLKWWIENIISNVTERMRKPDQKYYVYSMQICLWCKAKKKICVFTVTLATLWIFTQNSDNRFCCLTSSNVLFIQLLAFCRNWNTGIGFWNQERLFLVLPIIKKKKKKFILADRP